VLVHALLLHDLVASVLGVGSGAPRQIRGAPGVVKEAI